MSAKGFVERCSHEMVKTFQVCWKLPGLALALLLAPIDLAMLRTFVFLKQSTVGWEERYKFLDCLVFLLIKVRCDGLKFRGWLLTHVSIWWSSCIEGSLAPFMTNECLLSHSKIITCMGIYHMGIQAIPDIFLGAVLFFEANKHPHP